MDVQLLYDKYCEWCETCSYSEDLAHSERVKFKISCIESANKLIVENYPIMRQPMCIKNPLLIETYDDDFYTSCNKQEQPNNDIEMAELCYLLDCCDIFDGILFEPIHEQSLIYAIHFLRWCNLFLKQSVNNIPNNEKILLCFLNGVCSFDGKRLTFKIVKNDDGQFHVVETIYINKNTEGMYLIDFVMKYCT